MKHDDFIPRGIQLKRTAGWNLQAISKDLNGLEATKVDRTSRWGNPYRVDNQQTRAQSVAAFRHTLEGWHRLKLEEYLEPLRGRNLACWCPPGAPCHREVLLELANPGAVLLLDEVKVHAHADFDAMTPAQLEAFTAMVKAGIAYGNAAFADEPEPDPIPGLIEDILDMPGMHPEARQLVELAAEAQRTGTMPALPAHLAQFLKP